MGQRATRATEFSEFVAARRVMLHRTAWMLCGDPHRAEDIVQDALSKLYASWRRISRMDGIEAYARRAVVTSHLDTTRRPWRREDSRTDDRLDGPQREPLAFEESDALWQALRDLPEGQRRVVVLRHYWGLSVDEVATDLQISSGTVKSQSAAALAKLRQALTEPSMHGGDR